VLRSVVGPLQQPALRPALALRDALIRPTALRPWSLGEPAAPVDPVLTGRTLHRLVCGRHQHHVAVRPVATLQTRPQVAARAAQNEVDPYRPTLWSGAVEAQLLQILKHRRGARTAGLGRDEAVAVRASQLLDEMSSTTPSWSCSPSTARWYIGRHHLSKRLGPTGSSRSMTSI
jgi:hypothetical protein